MTDRELMQQALNVLKIFVDGGNSAWARKIIEIKEALRDRLAQPEEPDWSAAGFGKPQRDEAPAKAVEWQGLTDEEIRGFEIWLDDEEEKHGWNPPADIVKYIEAKLKEKNGTI
jgi:hypothetical protein